jgi:hypothetical protein
MHCIVAVYEWQKHIGIRRFLGYKRRCRCGDNQIETQKKEKQATESVTHPVRSFALTCGGGSWITAVGMESDCTEKALFYSGQTLELFTEHGALMLPD